MANNMTRNAFGVNADEAELASAIVAPQFIPLVGFATAAGGNGVSINLLPACEGSFQSDGVRFPRSCRLTNLRLRVRVSEAIGGDGGTLFVQGPGLSGGEDSYAIPAAGTTHTLTPTFTINVDGVLDSDDPSQVFISVSAADLDDDETMTVDGYIEILPPA